MGRNLFHSQVDKLLRKKVNKTIAILHNYNKKYIYIQTQNIYLPSFLKYTLHENKLTAVFLFLFPNGAY